MVERVCGLSAIFHAAYVPERQELAVVDATGVLSLYGWDNDDRLQLRCASSNKAAAPSSYLHFVHSQERYYVCRSDGGLDVYRDTKDGSMSLDVSFQAHAAEVWTVAALNDTEALVLTGADDGFLKLWDLRLPEPSRCVLASSRGHSAGLTSLLPLSNSTVLSGSYDQSLSLWDLRRHAEPMQSLSMASRPQIGPRHLGLGSLWRLCPITPATPCDDPTVLRLAIAGMYGGASVGLLCLTDLSFSSRLTVPHDSIVYGIDVLSSELPSSTFPSDGLVLATCSFYDKTLKFTRFTLSSLS